MVWMKAAASLSCGGDEGAETNWQEKGGGGRQRADARELSRKEETGSEERTGSGEWSREEQLPRTKGLLYLGNVKNPKCISLNLKTVMMMWLFSPTLQT